MALLRSDFGCSFREARDPPLPSLRTAFARARPASSTAAKVAGRLAALRQTVEALEAGDRGARAGHLSLGLPMVDSLLPGVGLACGALHEVAPLAYGDRPPALGFAFALAALAQRTRPGVAVLIASRPALQDFGRPYGHGLKALGLDVGRLLLVETRNDREALWALEETLKSTAAPSIALGVIGGRETLSQLTVSRRLNLAAASGGTPLVLASAHANEEASAAVTRWRIGAAARGLRRLEATDGDHFMCSSWSVDLVRCRNGRTGHWLLEWDHVAHHFHLAQGLAARAPCAGRGPIRLAV